MEETYINKSEEEGEDKWSTKLCWKIKEVFHTTAYQFGLVVKGWTVDKEVCGSIPGKALNFHRINPNFYDLSFIL